MKTLLILLCCISFTNVDAQYVIDFKNAPLNPIPLDLKYTTSHFGLKGNVKKLTVIKGFSEDAEYLFDEKGRLTQRKNDGLFSNGTDKIIYDKKGFISKIEIDRGSSYTFETDKKGRIVKSISGQDGKSHTYTYNDKGFCRCRQVYCRRLGFDHRRIRV